MLSIQLGNPWVLLSSCRFCSGPNGAHRRPLRTYQRVLLCDWPAEEANRESFDVFLEDARKKQRAFGAGETTWLVGK